MRALIALAALLVAQAGLCATQDAITFDGTGDAATCGNAVHTFQASEDWTVATYVRWPDIANASREAFWGISRDATSLAEQMSNMLHPSDALLARSNTSDLGGGMAVAATTWYAVVLRNTGSTTTMDQRLYAEAASSTSATDSGMWSNVTSAAVRFALGALWDAGSSAYINNNDVRLAFVAVLSEKISDAEANSYASDPINTVHGWITTKAATLELWLEDAADIQGGAVQDYSGNNRDCTLVADATVSSGGGPNVADLPTSIVSMTRFRPGRPIQ